MATAALKGSNFLSRVNCNAGLAPGGPWLQAALGGTLFAMSSVASVTLPINAGTLATTFTLYNPPTSGKIIELVEYGVSFAAAEVIASTGIAMAWQANVSAAGAPISPTVIDGAPASTLLGLGVSPVGIGWKAATLTNAAAMPTIQLGIYTNNSSGTTAAQATAGGLIYTFHGKILLPPDTIVTFISSKTALPSVLGSLIWAEWAL